MSEFERARDKARIDSVIDAWMRELEGDPGLEALTLASRSLVPLLERRSKLLGLDATPGAAQDTEKPSAAVQRILSAVPGGAGK